VSLHVDLTYLPVSIKNACGDVKGFQNVDDGVFPEEGKVVKMTKAWTK
jgi:hypothetical protein